ncbi:MAG: acyl-CoA dehydrogenase [Planctomycetota bacterium]|nr:MAG: acyl-CoA dehydrogenase [Planctomycetota bacterium]
MAFIQEPPQLENQYLSDLLLRSYLKRFLDGETLKIVEEDLTAFGDRVLGDIYQWGLEAEEQEPKLVQYDGWGKRVDQIVVSRGWQDLKKVSAEEGLVAIGYERQFGPLSRLYQFAKLYLFTPSSAIYTCPLAMTDGAARLIEIYGDDFLKKGAYPKLVSRDPDKFWVSGQWMTEKTGGSDVGRTETIARKDGDCYRLYGEKWFTSAMPSEMAMTLARIEDEEGNVVPGSRGLSLFYVEVFDQKGSYNQIEIMGLKDKLGTRALPTAELKLNGTPARLVGTIGRGVAQIATLFNITRMYNACSAVSYMRRTLAYAKDYANRREAFGKLLRDHPLHRETLARMEVEFQGAFHLAFYISRLLGKVDTHRASEDEVKILRILTPLAKLYTGKQCVAMVSEAIEALGGAGYLEPVGIAKYLRDGQTLAIWEGTTNVLCLDVLRAMTKEQALPPLFMDIEERLKRISHPDLIDSRDKALASLGKLIQYTQENLEEERSFWEGGARGFAYGLSRVLAASLLLEHGEWGAENGFPQFLISAKWWCHQDLAPLVYFTSKYGEEALVLSSQEEVKIHK